MITPIGVYPHGKASLDVFGFPMRKTVSLGRRCYFSTVHGVLLVRASGTKNVRDCSPGSMMSMEEGRSNGADLRPVTES